MDKKIRVLAIAPYEGLRAEIMRSAGGFSDIELVDVQVGNLEEGAALVAAYEPSAYDAVLSRGGTTLYIEKVTDKPVFEIPLTYPDLLNIFKLVENYNGRILILCYPNIRSDVDNLCAILNLRYDIDDIFSWSDAEEKVRNAQQAGYSMIIGDAVSIAYTGKYQLQSMLLVSGRSSVQSAFRNILKTYRSFNGMQREYQLLKRYVNSLQGHFIALDNQGRPLFNAASAPETIVNLCRQQLPRLRRDMTSFGLYACAESYLELVGRKAAEPLAGRISEDIYFFTVTESRFGRGKAGRYHGTASFSRAKLLADEAVSGSFHNNVSAALMQRYDNIIASSLSLLITGEPGTEKHVLANQIFLKRAGEQDLLYAVDCSEMTYKLFRFLLESDSSPLYQDNVTVLFKKLHALSAVPFEEFLNSLRLAMDLQGGRILLTYEFRRKNKEVYRTDIQRIEAVKNILSIPEILLEPLQGRAEDIENYALLYIHHCNEQLGTNVVGLEPEAMGLLEAYPWNYNLRELERILREAVQTARSPWLSAAAIRELLRQEKETAKEKNAVGLNLHKTLAEIEYDIVREVLAEENMNQSAAAQRLGINRSTIWRILRRHERDLP